MEQHFSVRSLQRNSSNVFDTVEDARNTHYELIPLRDADIRYYPCFFEQETADRYFQTLLREAAWEQRTLFVFGKHRLEPRLTAWYGDEGASYSYSGTTRHPKPWTPLLREIKQRVEEELEGVREVLGPLPRGPFAGIRGACPPGDDLTLLVVRRRGTTMKESPHSRSKHFSASRVRPTSPLRQKKADRKETIPYN